MLFVSILYLYSGLAGGDHLRVDPTESNSLNSPFLHFAQALQMVMWIQHSTQTLQIPFSWLTLQTVCYRHAQFLRSVLSSCDVDVADLKPSLYIHQSDAAA